MCELLGMVASHPADVVFSFTGLALRGGRIDDLYLKQYRETLEPGAPADLVLVDPEAPWLIDADALPGLAGNTPFDGLPVQGRALRLWKGGREIGG